MKINENLDNRKSSIKDADHGFSLPNNAQIAEDALELHLRRIQELQDIIDPISKFRDFLKQLLQHVPNEYRKRIKVNKMAGELVANATSRRRQLAFLGYIISVNPNLYVLLYDAAEFVISGAYVVSKSGDLLVESNISHSRLLFALKEGILNYINGKASWSLSRPLMISRLIRKRIELFTHVDRRVDGFETVFLDSMTLFTMAHEVGHIIAGHCDKQKPRDLEEQWVEEFVADILATGLLNQVYTKIATSKGLSNEETASGMGGAFCGVSILFTILDIVDKVANQLGKNWNSSHPPGKARYEAFRDICITKLGYSEDAFAKPIYGFDSPDILHRRLSDLAALINWS